MVAPRVAIYGATGTTGALVARALADQRVSLLLGGRDPARIASLRTSFPQADLRVVKLTDNESVGAFVQACDVLINCAGPYAQTNAPLEQAALAAGKHFVHLSGERRVIEATFARDEDARMRDVCLVPAAGFSSVVAEVATWLAIKGLATLDTLEVTITHTASIPSAGSIHSYLGEVTLPGAFYEAGRWHDEAPGAVQRAATYPPPFEAVTAMSAPIAEIFTLPIAFAPRLMRAFVATPGPATSVYIRDAPLLNALLEHRRDERGPTPEQRQRARFQIVVTASDAERVHTLTMTGSDPYGHTVALASKIALTVATGVARGARPAVALIDPQAFLAIISNLGTRWKIERAAHIVST